MRNGIAYRILIVNQLIPVIVCAHVLFSAGMFCVYCMRSLLSLVNFIYHISTISGINYTGTSVATIKGWDRSARSVTLLRCVCKVSATHVTLNESDASESIT